MPAAFLTSPVLGQLADLALWEADPRAVESCLVSRLEQVPDRRGRGGLRHPLRVVLVLTACATLVVGSDSVTAIWQWAARASQDVLERIGARRDPLLGRFTVPSERTFRRVLADLDADALDLATCGYAADVVRGTAPAPVIPRTPGPGEREERRAAQRAAGHPAPAGLLPGVAVDGKALRGARAGSGRVFTPLARKAAQALLAGTDAEFEETTAIEDDRGHARTERRTLRTAPTDDTLFPAARQVFRLRRDTGGRDGAWTSKEIVLGVTSLPSSLAGPEHLNYHQRKHWSVENRLHWVRDATFHEDNSQLRTGTAPRALASFRNLGINAFRLGGRANIAHARRDLLNHNDAFAVYGI